MSHHTQTFKFDKLFEQQKVPDWYNKYVDYNLLN
jgi:hypothetical protein